MGGTKDGTTAAPQQPGTMVEPQDLTPEERQQADEFWGEGDTKPEAEGGDPDKKPDASDESKEGDSGPDPATGSDEDKKGEGDEKTYAGGKYSSLEEFEKGWANQEKFIETLKQEGADHRTKITELEQKLAEITKAQDAATSEEARKAKADAMEAQFQDLLKNNADFKSAYDTLAAELGEEGAKAVLKMQVFGALTATPDQQVDSEARKLLTDLQAERIERQFLERRPEAAKVKDDIFELMGKLGQKQFSDDPMFILDLLFNSVVGSKIEEITEARAKNMLAKMSREEREKFISSNLTVGKDTSRDLGGDTDTRSDAQKQQDEYWGEDSRQ